MCYTNFLCHEHSPMYIQYSYYNLCTIYLLTYCIKIEYNNV